MLETVFWALLFFSRSRTVAASLLTGLAAFLVGQAKRVLPVEYKGIKNNRGVVERNVVVRARRPAQILLHESMRCSTGRAT